jgi:hypothetical protein
MLDTKAAGHKLWFLKDPPSVLKLVFHDNHDCCKGNEEAKATLDGLIIMEVIVPSC